LKLCRPYGTLSYSPLVPALKRWAKIWYGPGTYFTDQTGDILYTFGSVHEGM